RVLLPPGTFPDTLILTENDVRVRNYRIAPQSGEVYYSQAAFRYDAGNMYGGGGTSYALMWESGEEVMAADTRTIKLEYMMSGAHWTPTYDMMIRGEDTVDLAFFAEIQNSTLLLEDATVYLVAGRVDLSQQVGLGDQMTFNQAAVGYADTAELPAMGVGAVDLQHIYPLEAVSAAPGDIVYVNLVEATLEARRLLVWNAIEEREVDVIYKVRNTTEIPFAEGIVRSYQDGLFMGSDYIETTPVGGEGSVTVGSLPDVRVRRTESEEYFGGTRDYYLHTVTLEVENFGETDLALSIVDRWMDQAWQFEYTPVAPERQTDNLLRWDVTVAVGEKVTITYTFRTEY
ncbi:MAG: DUF4139 domain-containing protein, partial [Anaerolineae bacterium]|nr:DUF4139 domain-containing protein [Anaerolineae bacterium]